MKKNEIMGFIAYLFMLAIALVIGLVILRPYYNIVPGGKLQLNPALITLFSVIVGIFVTANFVEIGHLIGAKLGKYDVKSFVVLGVGYKKDAKGNKKLYLGSYDGLMGETRIVPKDIKTSKPSHYAWMPFLMLIIEAIICIVLSVLFFQNESELSSSVSKPAWVYPAAISCLAIVIMEMIYDYFPAKLDTKNDGYATTVISKKENIVPFNQLLVAEDNLANNIPAGELSVYDNVTDFTAAINNISLYNKLSEKDYEGALSIVEKTIKCKKNVSSNVYYVAQCQKICIICMIKTKEEAKEAYLSLDDDTKKYISVLSSIQAVRAYVLINGLIQDSISETKAGLQAVNKAVSKCDPAHKNVEKLLVIDSLNKVKQVHPDWDFGDFEIVTKTKKEDKKK